MGNMLKQKSVVDCRLRTLSSIMQDQALDCVDLLKIDVERAELDVLAGLDDCDWPKVQQLVMEVHDIEDRLQVVEQLLRGQCAFATVVTVQAPQLQGSNLFTVYCTRRPQK